MEKEWGPFLDVDVSAGASFAPSSSSRKSDTPQDSARGRNSGVASAGSRGERGDEVRLEASGRDDRGRREKKGKS